MNFNNPKLLAGLAFSALCFTASQATAAAPVFTSNQTISFSEGSSDIGDTFGKDLKGYDFISNFIFQIPENSDLGSAIISVSLGKTDLSFTGFNLYKDSGTLVNEGTKQQSGVVDVWTMSALNLGTGAYRVAVTGSILGANGGSFGGNIAVSPVPEPSTWAMMIGGIGLVFMAARRRKTMPGPQFSASLAA